VPTLDVSDIAYGDAPAYLQLDAGECNSYWREVDEVCI